MKIKNPEANERGVAPYPIKRVDRLVKLLNQWADRWISAENGLIGFYEKVAVLQYTMITIDILYTVYIDFNVFSSSFLN